MPVDLTLTVLEAGQPITFHFDDLMRYHGHGFPGGVAHAFAAMRAGFARLDAGQPLERREVVIRTAFKGPGGHDAMEMVTRGRNDGRTTIAPELGQPQRGILQNYVWEFGYRGHVVRVQVCDDGIVDPAFIALGQKQNRSTAEEAELTALKAAMTDRINARAPAAVYLVV